MQEVNVKICCISSIEEANMAIHYGASAIGLVGRMPSGPGVIDDELIDKIAKNTGAECLKYEKRGNSPFLEDFGGKGCFYLDPEVKPESKFCAEKADAWNTKLCPCKPNGTRKKKSPKEQKTKKVKEPKEKKVKEPKEKKVKEPKVKEPKEKKTRKNKKLQKDFYVALDINDYKKNNAKFGKDREDSYRTEYEKEVKERINRKLNWNIKNRWE
jgi:hypothetical protein